MPIPSMVDLHRPAGDGIDIAAAAIDEGHSTGIMLGPEFQAPLTEVVFVVKAEFFEAGPGYIGELELHLAGSAAGLTSLGNVLHTTARRLDHLVVGAATGIDKAITESHGQVEGELRDLEAL